MHILFPAKLLFYRLDCQFVMTKYVSTTYARSTTHPEASEITPIIARFTIDFLDKDGRRKRQRINDANWRIATVAAQSSVMNIVFDMPKPTSLHSVTFLAFTNAFGARVIVTRR